MTCPSAGSGGTDEAGGHLFEPSTAGVNVSALLKSESKRIQGQKIVKKPITHGNHAIGEEQTTLRWTVHLQRVGKVSRF